MKEQIWGEGMGRAYYQDHKNDPEYKDMLEGAKKTLKTYFNEQDAMFGSVWDSMAKKLQERLKNNVKKSFQDVKTAIEKSKKEQTFS